MGKKTKKKTGFLLRIRNYFTAGALVLAPTAVSVWILVQVFRWFDNILGKWYTQLFEYLELDVTHIPGLGALTLFLLITLIGILARQYAGRKILELWEKGVTNVPLINRVYITIRQLADAFSKGGDILFLRPVIVEYPRKGLYSVGFVTSRCEGSFCKIIGQDVSTVFIPTTPNPTSGMVVFVPNNDLIPIAMSVEDAMKFVISGGALASDIRLPVAKE